MNVKQCVCIMLLSGLLFFHGSVISVSQSTSSTVWYVGGSGEGNMSSISTAINQASPGDTVMVYPGVYDETLVIDISIDLVGISMNETIIRGDGLHNVINVNADQVSISGFHIQQSGRFTGAGTSPDLRTIQVNFSGIFSESSDIHISSCEISECHTGVFLRKGSGGSITNSRLVDNVQGGYIVSFGTVEIRNCDLVDNDIGWYFSQAIDSEISLCTISSCMHTGIIMVDRSQNNEIYSNQFLDNARAIAIDPSSTTNRFFFNSFINSTHMHVFDEAIGESKNRWDDGIQGNYWDDYDGVDSDGDGIGDTPYEIFIDNSDRSPLMQPKEELHSKVTITVTSPLLFDDDVDLFFVSGICESDAVVQQVYVRIDDGEWVLVEGTSQWNQSFDRTVHGNDRHEVSVYALVNDVSSPVTSFSLVFEERQGTDDPDVDDPDVDDPDVDDPDVDDPDVDDPDVDDPDVDDPIDENDTTSEDTNGFTLLVVVIAVTLCVVFKKISKPKN